MTTPATPGDERNVRALGWDIDSSFSSNRGELLPIGSFGHTGFTGTSLWIDPATGMFVVFLSNRVHPDGKGDVTPLRARVATVAASALDVAAAIGTQRRVHRTRLRPRAADAGAGPARAGPDRPRRAARRAASRRSRASASGSSRTTPAAPATARRPSICCTRRKDVTLVALFSPEHGIRGILDAKVPSEVDEKTRLPIHSLYGDTRRPTAAMLEGIDAMVIDLQDIGARFYTYMTTMAYVMEEAAKRNLPVFVLDRPNPINGFQIEGPALDKAMVGFTGYFPAMPIRHGMTLGELARLFNGENKIGADLTVVPMKNWDRDRWFDDTGLPWINPVAEHAQPDPGDALSRHRRDRGHERLGRPRHRHAVRADRRAVDRRRAAGRGAERARHSRRQASTRCGSRPRPASTRTRSARACSWSSPTARRCGRSASASRSPRCCTSCTARSTSSRRPSGCSDRRTASRGSGRATIRRRSRPRGRRRGALAAAAREVPALPLIAVGSRPHGSRRTAATTAACSVYIRSSASFSASCDAVRDAATLRRSR